MVRKQQETVVCQICKEHKRHNEVIPFESIHGPLAERIKEMHPDSSPSGFVCISDLNKYRSNYVRDILEKDKGELTTLDEQVMKSLAEHELLSKNTNIEFDQRLTLGQRLADGMADYAGSWHFIIIFMGILILWIIINSVILLLRPFDPYPFILLNLVLSCIAALQAPVIMMSQNRQESKDRLRAEHDYMVNLKAELEIRHLHEKIDHLITNQWQRLLEIQEVQTELMEELTHKTPRGH
ncbi:MAG: DUF1003 domain-containing protein [Dehalococcoidia bacterium]|jgi:uncharacterized membrane protein